jgi:hypothetical protein
MYNKFYLANYASQIVKEQYYQPEVFTLSEDYQ